MEAVELPAERGSEGGDKLNERGEWSTKVVHKDLTAHSPQVKTMRIEKGHTFQGSDKL